MERRGIILPPDNLLPQWDGNLWSPLWSVIEGWGCGGVLQESGFGVVLIIGGEESAVILAFAPLLAILGCWMTMVGA